MSTSFEIGISAQATGVTSAADSVANLSQTLEKAGAAATKASEMVATGEAAYKRAEAAAKAASLAVERNALKLGDLRAAQEKAMNAGDEKSFWKTAAAIDALSQKQTAAQALAQSTGQAFDNEANKLDSLKQAAAGATKAADDLRKSHDAAAKAEKAATKEAEDLAAKQKLAAEGSGKLNEAAEGFGKLGGPVGMLGQKALGTVEGVKKLFSSVGSGKAMMSLAAVGVVGLVVALATLAVGLATGVVKIGLWAVGLSDASRSAGLLSAGIAQSVKGGKDLEAALDKMQNRFPQSREELQGMAGDLAKTGLKGKALEAALDEAATKAAKLKFGPEWEKQVNALPNLSKRFNQNISGIFGSLNVDKLLSGLGDLVNLFDANATTGKALKSVFGSIFQPAIDGAAGFIPKIVGAFIQFEIWILKALIAIKPFGSSIKMIGLGVVAMGAMIVAPLVGIAAGVAALAAGAVVAVQGFRELWDGAKAAYDKLSAMSFSEIGTMLIDGLVGGITSGIDKVIGAVTGVADSAIGAAKSVLGIASPSKVFAQIGGFTAEGMSMGVDDGAGDVRTSLENLASPPDAQPAAMALGSAGGAPSAAGGSSGATITIEQGAFVFNGVAGAEDAKDFFTQALEGLAAQLGSQVPA